MKNLRKTRFLAFCAVLGGGCGFIGFILLDPFWLKDSLSDAILSVLDAVYGMVRLFILEGPSKFAQTEMPESAKILLNTGRFLAPLSLAGALVSSLLRFWAPRVNLMRLGLLEDHLIVLGANPTAIHFLTNAKRDGRDVACLVKSEVDARRLRGQFGENLPVIVARSDIVESWRLLGASKCREIVLVDSSDKINLTAMNVIADIDAGQRITNPLRVFTHIGNEQLRRELVRQTQSFAAPKGMQFEPISTSELAARHFFHQRDFFYDVWRRSHNRVHWVVFGLDENASAFLTHFLRISPFARFDTPKLSIICAPNTPACQEFKNLISNCSSFVDVDFYDSEPSLGLPAQQILDRISKEPVSAILVADAGGQELELALQLRGQAHRDGLFKSPIFFSSIHQTGLGLTSLGNTTSGISIEISKIAEARDICSIAFLTGVPDQAAKQFHIHYHKEHFRSDRSSSPSLVSWSLLDENYRSANRRTADHAKTKLEFLSLLGPLATYDPLEESEIEPLANMEHDSWHVDRLLNGWHFAEARDDMARHHPNLVAYADLDEPTKQIDRQQIRHLFDILKQQGSVAKARKRIDIGLIGHNRVNTVEAKKIYSKIVQEILPDLQKRFADADLHFYTPLAPGCDFIMAQGVAASLDSEFKGALSIVQTLPPRKLIGEYEQSWQANTVWSIDPPEVQGVVWDVVKEDIYQAHMAFTARYSVIDIADSNLLSGGAKKSFAHNAHYFATRMDILIGFLDESRSHGIGGTKETVELARKNGLEIILI